MERGAGFNARALTVMGGSGSGSGEGER